MTHRALAQEGPDLRREDISISPPRRRRHRHKGLARSRSNAVEDSRLGRLSHWPVLPRPQLAGFQVSTEALTDRRRRSSYEMVGVRPEISKETDDGDGNAEGFVTALSPCRGTR